MSISVIDVNLLLTLFVAAAAENATTDYETNLLNIRVIDVYSHHVFIDKRKTNNNNDEIHVFYAEYYSVSDSSVECATIYFRVTKLTYHATEIYYTSADESEEHKRHIEHTIDEIELLNFLDVH